jgi:5-aminopentanamidase
LKVAAYQAPLAECGSIKILDLIREQIVWCESAGVEILCCPEGVLGGLADYATRPRAMALDAKRGGLSEALGPLISDTVTTILGFTEIDRRDRLYNSTAVFHKGSVIGVYRKLYPAINQSIYQAGDKTPVFTVGDLTFGILICRDSNYCEPARQMASQGAAALFVPTNNGLPSNRAEPEIISDARSTDIARAIENGVSVIRADVAGRGAGLVSYGSSAIVDPEGTVQVAAEPLTPQLIVADIQT